MPHDDITHWRFGDVAERLLAGHSELNPPPDWHCWTKPAPALPIDDLIARLIRRNAEPRLQSPSELKEQQNVACPFYVVRFAIAAAVDAATAMAGEEPAEMAKRWRIQEEAARQAAAANATIGEALLQSVRRPAPRLPFLETPELIGAYKTVLMLRHIGAYDRIAEDARQWREFYQRARGDPLAVWRVTFAAELGFAWSALTGAVPAQNGEFTHFIATAYDSITDGLPEVSWDRPIRRVVGLGLDWEDRGMSFAEAQKIFLGW
jgi:hypothetical protein